MNIFDYIDKDISLFKSVIESNHNLINKETDSNGDTILAVLTNSKIINDNILKKIGILLDNGADANILLKGGYTPLMIACSNEAKDLRLIKLLISKGANPFIKGSQEFSAIDIVNPESTIASYYKNTWNKCFELLSNLSLDEMLSQQSPEVKLFIQKVNSTPKDIDQICFDFCEYTNKIDKPIEDILISIKEFVSPSIVKLLIRINQLIVLLMRHRFLTADELFQTTPKAISNGVYESYRNKYICSYVCGTFRLPEKCMKELELYCTDKTCTKEQELLTLLTDNITNYDNLKDTLKEIPQNMEILIELLQILPAIAFLGKDKLLEADLYINDNYPNLKPKYLKYREQFSKEYLVKSGLFNPDEIDIITYTANDITAFTSEQKNCIRKMPPKKLNFLRYFFKTREQCQFLDVLLLNFLLNAKDFRGLQELLDSTDSETADNWYSIKIAAIIKEKFIKISTFDEANYILRLIRKDLKGGLLLLENLNKYNFKKADKVFATFSLPSKIEYDNLKVFFVKKYLEPLINKNLKEKSSVINLDTDQVEAIIDMGKDVVVTARAGSGKTTTIVNKIIYETQKYNLKPNKIKAFVFNRGARVVLDKRLKKYGITEHIAQTFHSFAWNIYRKLLGKSPNVIDIENDSDSKSDRIADILSSHELITSRESLYKEIRNNNFVNTNGETYGQLLMGGPSLPIIQKYIGDFLFEHNLYLNDIPIEFGEIRKNIYYIKLRNGNVRYVESDFSTTLEGNFKIFIKCVHNSIKEEYQSHYSWANNALFIEYIIPDFRNINRKEIEIGFRSLLESNGFVITDKDKKDILSKFYEKNKDALVKFMENLINRYQQEPYSLEELRHKVDDFTYSNQNIPNINLLSTSLTVYKEYLLSLKKEDVIDFNILLKEIALELHKLGATKRNLSTQKKALKESLQELNLLFIDEFQDFTALFKNIIEEIRIINPNLRIFAVGDDWQGINSFAGADINLFNEYKQNSSQKNILTNHRSLSFIVELANEFMRGNHRDGKGGIPEKGNTVEYRQLYISKIDNRYKKELQVLAHSNRTDSLLFAGQILRIISSILLSNDIRDYLIICRTNDTAKLIEEEFRNLTKKSGFDKLFSNLNIEFTTAHKCKGKESMICFIVADDNSFPLSHPTNAIIDRFFKQNFLVSEENLFYVSLTRAKIANFILSPNNSFTNNLFVEQIKGQLKNWPMESLQQFFISHHGELEKLWNKLKKDIKEQVVYSDTETPIELLHNQIVQNEISTFFNMDYILNPNNKYKILYCIDDKNSLFYYLALYVPQREVAEGSRKYFMSQKIIDFKDPSDCESHIFFFNKLKKILNSNICLIPVPSSTVGKDSPFSTIIQRLVKSNKIIDGSSCLIRTKKITSAHLGGKRDLKVHMNSIALKNPEIINGKNVLLIDDIKTTGNSLRACESIIRKYARPKSILKFTLGKTICLK